MKTNFEASASTRQFIRENPGAYDAFKQAVREELVAHEASSEQMKIILERIENCTRRLKQEINSSTQLVTKLFDGKHDVRSGSIVLMEPFGEERETLAEASHPLVRIIGRGRGIETLLRVEERVWASHIITSLLCIVGGFILALATMRVKSAPAPTDGGAR